MKKRFLFAFDFKEGTMNDYILTFLKEHQTDWFYQSPGVLVADLFGTDEYYRLDIEDVVKDRKEVYYLPERKYHRSGLERLYPVKEKAIMIQEPCYEVKVYLENNDTFTTSINACKLRVFDYYMGKAFNMGTVEDNMQRVAWVEIIAYRGGIHMKEWNGKPVKKCHSAMDRNGNKVAKIFYKDGTTEIVRGGDAALLPWTSDKHYKSLSGLWRIIMNNFDRFFEGYKVPERIKNTTIAIMRRFTITGLYDGMYISNVIAHTCGIGDGQGSFTDDKITKFEEIAVNLQSAYGCNIFKKDIKELETILETGMLNKSQSIIGLNEYIAVCQSEKKNCDEWRVKYLDCCIYNANNTIQELEIIER